MDILHVQDIRMLIEQCGIHSVSIYMPTWATVPEVRQNPIQLKNLLDEAEEQLSRRELCISEIRELLAPAQDLWRNDIFWQDQSSGLVLLLQRGQMHVYRLPLPFEPRVVVGDCFDVKPLLPLLSGEGQFYLLALQQGKIQLFHGSRYSISEVDLEDAPDSLDEALQYDDPEKSLQFHTSTSEPMGGARAGMAGGERAAVYHGQGVGKDDAKVNIGRFFQMVDEGLSQLLHDEQIPLILAGIPYLQPLYRQANTYPHLLEVGIEQDPGSLSEQQLHERAWALVEPLFQASVQQAASRYRWLEGAGDGRAAHALIQVVPAAVFERVDTLFVPRERSAWGTLDSETGHVELHAQPQPGDRDLYDLAAIHTFINRGTVHVVEPEDIPGDGPVAAILRY